jgi:hypothetical protein
MNAQIPLACNMDVFTPEQREHHIGVTTQLVKTIQRVREIQNGYEFLFPNESQYISGIAEFIANEQLCCPFLEFGLTVRSSEPSIILALTGPVGTQEFLRVEFEEVFR